MPALVANLVWAGVLAWDSHAGSLAAPGHYFMEMLRYGGWLALMWTALPRDTNDGWLEALPRLIVAVWTLLVLLGAAAIALLLAAWAARSGAIGRLFDAVVDQLIGKVG